MEALAHMTFPNFVMWRSGYKEPTSTPMKDKYLGTVGKGRDFLRIPSEEIERALTKCACVYQKPKSERSGDVVRQGSRVNECLWCGERGERPVHL